MRDCLPSERVLATQYGVSRNVIREAIKILTEKKLVTNVIGKGNYVTLPNETDLVDTGDGQRGAQPAGALALR